MKRVQALCIGAAVAMVAAGAGLGCSSSSGGSPAEGTDSGTPGVDSSVPDTGTAADTGSTTTDSAAEAASVTTFAEVWTNVIDVHCVGCHSPPVGDAGAKGGFAIGHLDMSTADAGYANLVNVAAQGTVSLVDSGVACDTLAEAGVAGGIRVVPGDAGASLLYLKVNGFTTPPPCSVPMPANGEIPDGGQAAVVQEIQTWINEGAHP
jgi:hypothetical protein